MVGDEEFGFRMIVHQCIRFRIQPGVERVQHTSRHRHTMMRFQHGWRVRKQDRNSIAASQSRIA